MRQIALDIETTGLEPLQGHRVIEIGAVEIVDRGFTGARYHVYIDPERDIDDAAFEVHGLRRAILPASQDSQRSLTIFWPSWLTLNS